MSKRKTHPQAGRPGRPDPRPQAPSPRQGGRDTWIYGRHAALAALANPERTIRRIVVTEGHQSDLAAQLSSSGARRDGLPRPETLDRRALDGLLPRDAVHQGIAVLTAPLPDLSVAQVAEAAAARGSATILVLDQASDPHNIGAVLRSAAAFGASAVIMQDRHAPEATGALAKAASGALETVPLIHATNLSRALDELKQAGFWCLGFDGEAQTSIAEADLTGRVALVLGAEGAGLRRLVKEHCDVLVRIPIARAMESLNLSNAAAVALYEAARRRTTT